MVNLPIFNSDKTYIVKPSKIIALGLNYLDHIQESHSVNVKGFSKEKPSEPVLFPKLPSSIIGPNEPIIIPKFLLDYKFEPMRIDYEAELAFLIKDHCKNVPVSEAMEHIYGFTALNDVSQRNLQTGDKSGWFRGKSLDTFCPIGPQIVLTKDIGDPQNLNIECRLNGKKVQESNTKHMIFSIPEMFSFISKNFTLEPGDIISTGTPSGVGQIHHGDVVDIEIEKIGILSNPVIEEWK